MSTTANSGVSGMLSSITSAAKNLTKKASNVGASMFVPNSPTVTSGPGVNVSTKGGRRGGKRSKCSTRKNRKNRSTRKNRKNSR